MTDKAISPLRRRMIEDMTVRGFTACTQRGYIAAVTAGPLGGQALSHGPAQAYFAPFWIFFPTICHSWPSGSSARIVDSCSLIPPK